jgi:hypothetical protein
LNPFSYASLINSSLVFRIAIAFLQFSYEIGGIFTKSSVPRNTCSVVIMQVRATYAMTRSVRIEMFSQRVDTESGDAVNPSSMKDGLNLNTEVLILNLGLF